MFRGSTEEREREPLTGLDFGEWRRADWAIAIYLAQRMESRLIRVNISGHLRDYTGGRSELQIGRADDVLGMVKELNRVFPGIEQRILNDQEQIRTYVNVFVNSGNARDSEGERTRLRDGDVVHILPSVAGG